MVDTYAIERIKRTERYKHWPGRGKPPTQLIKLSSRLTGATNTDCEELLTILKADDLGLLMNPDPDRTIQSIRATIKSHV